MEPVKVVIADDDPLTRLDLRHALDTLGCTFSAKRKMDGRR